MRIPRRLAHPPTPAIPFRRLGPAPIRLPSLRAVAHPSRPMKCALPLVFSLVLGVSAVRADYVIVQKLDGALQSGNMTIKIKDTKVRADVAAQISTIMDSATGDSITLMHGQKSFMKMPAERTKALIAQMQKLQPGGAPAATPKLTPTGKKEKVDKYDCEVFTWTNGGMNVTYWICKDFPNFAQINAAMAKMQNAGVGAVGKGILPGAAELPGMVVKTEVTVGGQKITTTIVSVTEENVDPGVFQVPPDYKEIPMPAFGFPPAPSGK
jgi:Domain of unknown function (DUF4412)